MKIVTTPKEPALEEPKKVEEESEIRIAKEPKQQHPPTRPILITNVSPITRQNLKLEMIGSSLRIKLVDTTLAFLVSKPTNQEPPEPQVKEREGKGIATGHEESPKKPKPASAADQEEIKRKAEQAKLLEMTKSELIKVVHEEAKKAEINLKITKSTKGGVETLISYLVTVSNITTLENARFCQKLKELIAKHPDQEKLPSKKVKLESIGYKLD
uniref:Uncharacterized protein n=1 Tax=Tanacetum cinerariifolium TaxID=118510 RepID=A0A699GMW7_TANCI|nr:hypothetical protein [Tanacetum cinerariifolium]